jgi:hypothetical protein
MKKIIIVLISLMLTMIAQPANAFRAGQFCKTSDAMKIIQVKNQTLQCQLNGSRYRWKAVK